MNNELRKLAIPIIIQSLIDFLASSIDSLMITQLDPSSFSAVSLAAQLFLIVSLLTGGISGSLNVFASRYYGKKDYASIRAVFSYSLLINLIFNGLIAALCFLFPSQVMGLLTNNQNLISIGSEYLHLIGISYLFYGFICVIMELLRSLYDVNFTTYLSASILLLNGLLGYALIFGKLGFPALGVKGAAIASLSARGIQLLLLSVYLFIKEKTLNLKIRELFHPDRELFPIFIWKAAPIIANEFIWALGDSILVGLVGRLDEDIIQIYSISRLISSLASVSKTGMISAIVIYMGSRSGAGQDLNKELKVVRKAALRDGLMEMIFILAYIPFLGRINHLSGPALSLGIIIMLETGVIQFFSSVQSMYLMGVLRGLGEIRFGIINDTGWLWFFTLPLSYLFMNVFHFPFPITFLALKSDQLTKYISSLAWLRRYEKRSDEKVF